MRDLLGSVLLVASEGADHVGRVARDAAEAIARRLAVAAARAVAMDATDVEICEGCGRPVDPDAAETVYDEDAGHMHGHCASSWGEVAADCETCMAHVRAAHNDEHDRYDPDHRGMTRDKATEIATAARARSFTAVTPLSARCDRCEVVMHAGEIGRHDCPRAGAPVPSWVIDAIMLACEPDEGAL